MTKKCSWVRSTDGDTMEFSRISKQVLTSLRGHDVKKCGAASCEPSRFGDEGNLDERQVDVSGFSRHFNQYSVLRTRDAVPMFTIASSL